MRRLPAALLLLVACREAPRHVAIDTREPVAIRYVGAPEAVVRERPEDAAPEIAKFLSGESVSVLSEKGDWVEVRSGIGSGWVKKADLTTADEAQREQENPTPRFRVPPSPVTSPGTKGSIYIEASVNTSGDVVATRVLENTTGQPDLAERNAAALRMAKFHPIVQKGRKTPFLYYYRVDY